MLSFLKEHTNPLVIRGIRQALRSRNYLGQYLLALLASLIATLVFADYARDNPTAIDAGRQLFTILFGVLVVVLMPMQLHSAYQAMLRERQDSTWELVLLSGMRPMQVVRGMLQSAMLQAALMVSAVTPFLVMAYLLRGVDLGHVLLSLLIVCGLGVFSAAVGLLAGAATAQPLIRRLLWLPLLAGILFLSGIILVLGQNPADLSSEIVHGLRTGNAEVWFVCVLWLNIWGQAVSCCLIMAAALLGHAASDRSSGVRLALLGLTGNGLLWIGLMPLVASHFHLDDVFAAAGVWLAIMGAVIAFLGGVEDAALSPGQARSIREARGIRRLLIGLIGPGAARGLSAGLATMAAACACLLVSMSMGFNEEPSVFTALLLAYTAIFMGGGELCWRGRLGRLLDTPMKRGISLLLLIILLSALGPVLVLLSGTHRLEDHALIIISPIFAVPLLADDEAWHLATPVLILGGLGLIPMLLRALRRGLATQRVRADDRDA